MSGIHILGASGSGTTTLAEALSQKFGYKHNEEREKQRYGEAIAVDGKRYESHLKFMEWASNYDGAGTEMRSKALHEEWLEKYQIGFGLYEWKEI